VSGGSARRIQRELLDDPASLRPNPSMGFNKRKMEDQRRDAAEKEAAARRATEAQCVAAVSARTA